MENLLAYLNSLSPEMQEFFAGRCGTSVAYIRKAVSAKQKFGESLCILFERESRGVVTCEQLRPDLLEQWNYIRGTKRAKSAA
jgi:DNA-binding transcriptional regulator YdaS (Cro superfamily)